jgi:hypothetical protein
MLHHLEDFWFLTEGHHDYPAAESERDWFNLGGFSKIQPNLCRVPEIYATLDEVKPFIRMYFNFVASLINKQDLTFWEVFTPGSGSWGSTESSGYFLVLTRLMMLTERGDELWLAPLLTDQWFKEGMEVVLSRAPTRFGLTSYRIKSAVRNGFIQAVIEPPTRTPPKEIVIRLRHPEGRRIRTVRVEGAPHKNFEPSKGLIRLTPSRETIHAIAEY